MGQSTSISGGATRLEVVATKINTNESSTVNVEVRDACGGQGNFDPVFTELKVQQGGVVRSRSATFRRRSTMWGWLMEPLVWRG